MEEREATRLSSRETIQRRFEEVDNELSHLRAELAGGPSTALPLPIDPEEEAENSRTEAMKAEFLERQAASDKRVAAMQTEAEQANVASEELMEQMKHWMHKAEAVLLARNMKDLPKDIRLAAERAADGEEDSPKAVLSTASAADPSAEENALERDVEKLKQELVMKRQKLQALETKLTESLRTSDSLIGRNEELHKKQRELQTELAAAQAAAGDAERELAAARARLKVTIELKEAETLASREAEAGPVQPKVESSTAGFRQKVESLRKEAESLLRENQTLEDRLTKFRAAAAADLERAVPLSSGSCWQSLDWTLMRISTVLVRSICLRRAFAVHLLAMYGWLFWLIFWLEKH